MPLPLGVGDALDGEVVRLGPAGREHDLVVPGTQEPRDPGPRGLDRIPRLPPETVDARCVSVELREVRQHDLQHLGMDGSRRVVVEIDTSHVSLHLMSPARRPGARAQAGAR